MKKLLYPALALGALLALGACSDDNKHELVGDGATFTIQLPTDLQTRATFGDASTVDLNNLQWSVYEISSNGDATFITSGQKAGAFANSQTEEMVQLDLVNGHTYQVVFYADNADNDYATYSDGKVSINYSKGASNSKQEDAFVGKSKQINVTGSFNEVVTLTRPYAQLNWGTDDLTKPAVANMLDKLTAQVSISSGLYTDYTILDGKVSNPVSSTVTFPAVALNNLPAETFPVENYSLLAMNYLLTGEGTVDCHLAFNNNVPAVDVNAAPVNINYRTNIYGSLLTSPGNFNILINHDWNEPDYNNEVTPQTEAEFLSAVASPAVTTINVTKDMDLSSATTAQLTFNSEKTINISNGSTLQLGGANYITANQGITINGGTVSNMGAARSSDANEDGAKDLILAYGGDVNLSNVTLISDTTYHYHGSSKFNSAILQYWNNCTINIDNVNMYGGEFAICGMAGATNTSVLNIKNSNFTSTSSSANNGTNWAYTMRLSGTKATIDNCTISAIQGGISTGNPINIIVNGGRYVTHNTPGKQDAFYPVYVTQSATVTINGGEFIGANNWSSLAEGTSCIVCGDNDAGQPSGNVVLRGGKYSGKAYNHVTNKVYTPAAPYVYQALTGQSPLLWEVVKD